MYKRLITAAVLLAFGSGECLSGNSGTPTAQRIGSDINLLVWEPLSEFTSGVSIRDENGEVLERLAAHDADLKVYYEAMQLAHGNMLYERRTSVAEGSFYPADQALIRRYAASETLGKFNINVLSAKVQQRATEGGNIFYLLEQGGDHKCLAFFRYSAQSQAPTPQESSTYEALTGESCVPLGSAESESLEKDFLDLASRVVFDGGRLAHDKMFGQAFAQLQGQVKGPDILVPFLFHTQDSTAAIEGRVMDETGVQSLSIAGHKIAFDKENGHFQVNEPVSSGTTTLVIDAVNTKGVHSKTNVKVIRGQEVAHEAVQPGKSYALFFAEQNYQSRDMILDTPIYDSEALAAILRDSYGYQVMVEKDLGRNDLLAKLRALSSGVELHENDDLIVFYSGHGVAYPAHPAPPKTAFWITTDYRDQLSSGAVSVEEVTSALRLLPPNRILLVSDSCFSGVFAVNKITQAPTAPSAHSRTVLTSAGIAPVRDTDGTGHSPFVHHLLDTLRAKKGSGLTAFDIFTQVRELMLKRPEDHQEPNYGALLMAGHMTGGGYYFQ